MKWRYLWVSIGKRLASELCKSWVTKVIFQYELIEKFKAMIPVQQRLLPPTPLITDPIQEEAESSYVTLHQTNWTASTTSNASTTTNNSTSKMPIQCDSSSVNSEGQTGTEGGGYVAFYQSPTNLSPQHARIRDSPPMASRFSDRSSTTTDDDEDEIYAEPYADVLQPLQQHHGE